VGASLRATLSISIFPIENHNIYRKWVEKAAFIRHGRAFGKDFHYNRWRNIKKRINNSFLSLVQKQSYRFA